VHRTPFVCLISAPSQTLSLTLVTPHAGGRGNQLCLGGTSKAYSAAKVVDDGDGSFVIEDVVNTAYRCPAPLQPLFHRNQLNSCILSFSSMSAHGRLLGHGEAAPSSSGGPAALQGCVLEGACDDDWVFNKNGKTRTPRWTHGSSFTRAVAWSSNTWRRARSCCPGTIFLHLRDGLAAGVFYWGGQGFRPVLYWGGQGAQCARAFKKSLSQVELRSLV
jgi:hypothetical protein